MVQILSNGSVSELSGKTGGLAMGLFSGRDKAIDAAMKRLGHVEAGSVVAAVFKGKSHKGMFLHWAGGVEKGKARVELEGDTAKYREIPAADISLIPVKKAAKVEPEEKVSAEVRVIERGEPVPDLYSDRKSVV